MSTPRIKSANILFIDKIGNKPLEVNPHEFARKRGFEWTDEIIMSEEAKAQITKEKNIVISTKVFDPVKAWEDILSSHEEATKHIAIYDTEETCGLGLIAVDPIPETQFIKFPGVWSFGKNKGEATSYTYTLLKKDNSMYGRVDASKHRNLTSFAMSAEFPGGFRGYKFMSSDMQTKIATANLQMHLFFRPNEIQVGPPFMLALKPTRFINPGEPLVWDYGDSFYLDKSNYITEKFFNRFTGAVIDTSHYTVIEFRIRVWIKDYYAEFYYEKNRLENKESVVVDVRDNKKMVLDWQEIQSAINKKPCSRYLLFSRPSFIAENAAELSFWLNARKKDSVPLSPSSTPESKSNPALAIDSKRDPGKVFRNLVVSKEHNPTQILDFLTKIPEAERQAVIDSQGEISGMTALHCAAQRKLIDKIKMLVEELKADVTLPDKQGKTAYQLAEEAGASEELLLMLRPKALGITRTVRN